MLKGGEEQAALLARTAFETINENLKVYIKVDEAIDAEAESEKIRNKIEELQK